MRSMMKKLTLNMAVFIATFMLLPSGAFAQGNGDQQHEYVRLVGGSGYGFCEFERNGRHVVARLWVTGLGGNHIGTAWVKFDGEIVDRLGGTVATLGGDVEIRGEFKVLPGTEVTLDAREHDVSIQDIGNAENDPGADQRLNTELTTPAPLKLGTCTTTL